MSKISCNIIEDLSPLYVDDVCSDESKKVIEEHILECEECKIKIQNMQQILLIEQPVLEENIKEKKLFSKVKKKWIISIVLTFLLSFIFFLFLHIPTLFQEGNPLCYAKSFVQLMGFKDYVEITGVGEYHTETIRYLTRYNDYEEFLNYIEKEYQMDYEGQMGSVYLFRTETSSLAITNVTYMKFFTIWKVEEVHYKYANEIFTQNLYKNLIEIDIVQDNEKILIDDSKGMLAIYNLLSPLKLTEIPASSSDKNDSIDIQLIGKDNTVSVTLTSEILRINGKQYTIEKRIENLYNNIKAIAGYHKS